MGHIQVKRIYEPYDKSDGYRVLVDRLWPRGVSKEEAKLDKWAKDIAPSTDLRKWFGHVPTRFEEFKVKYLEQLHNDEDKIKQFEFLVQLLKTTNITLLFAAKNTLHNHSVILKEELKNLII